MQACDQALIKEVFAREVVQPRKWADGISPASSIDRNVRFVSAKTSRNGSDLLVMVFVAEPNSIGHACGDYHALLGRAERSRRLRRIHESRPIRKVEVEICPRTHIGCVVGACRTRHH